MKVVLIEDDEGIRDVVQLVLQRAGYILTVLPKGDSILSGSFDSPDLFIVDFQLPGIGGLDLCRFIKAQPNLQSIPVLILSAAPGLHDQALEAGADDFLEKPFSSKSLLAMVRRLTGDRQ